MGYHVICAYCEKSHYGEQVWDDKLKGYICLECQVEIEGRFKHQGNVIKDKN
jgi:hypothetical protein